MKLNAKERIIFDMDSYDENWWRDVFEQYKDDEFWQQGEYSPDDPDSYLSEDLMREDYEEEISALEAFFAGEKSVLFNYENPLGGNTIIAIGNVGRWDGTRSGITPYQNFEEVIDTSPSWLGKNNVFADCEIQKIWDENGHLFIQGSHHDGSVIVELRQLTDAGMEALEAMEEAGYGEPCGGAEKTYDGSRESISEFFHDLLSEPSLAPLPRYMELCFGCKAEEWDIPDPVLGHEKGKQCLVFSDIELSGGQPGADLKVSLSYCIDDGTWMGGETDLLGWHDLDIEDAASYAKSIGLQTKIAELQEKAPQEWGFPEKASEIEPRDADLHVGKWRVHLVFEGQSCGVDGRFIYGDTLDTVTGERVNDCQKYGAGLPMVEFYDESQDPGRFPGGQYVSGAYASNLLGCGGHTYDGPIAILAALGGDLVLSEDRPEWTLNSEELGIVANWLESSIPAADLASAKEAHRTVMSSLYRLSDEARESRSASGRLAIVDARDEDELDAASRDTSRE